MGTVKRVRKNSCDFSICVFFFSNDVQIIPDSADLFLYDIDNPKICGIIDIITANKTTVSDHRGQTAFFAAGTEFGSD